MNAITVMLDEEHASVSLTLGDKNEYTLGRIGKHNVAIVGPARGAQGKVAIADVVGSIRWTFRNMTVGLLVGIGGGVPHLPKQDVRLGDVVIGAPEVGPAVVQYDLGKETITGFEVTRVLNKPPALLLQVVNAVEDRYLRQDPGEESFFTIHLRRFDRFPRLRERYKRPSAPDRLFRVEYCHEAGSECKQHDEQFEVPRTKRVPLDEIQMHYSTILSGDRVMKSEVTRDRISGQFHNALCFEMEAAGLMDIFPCLVVRGICDYSDSHKNKEWQEYAAATAAAYSRELLLTMAERVVQGLERPKDRVDKDIHLSPIWHIPFDRMSGFVGRTDELVRVKKRIFESDSRPIVSILGLGGIGKSRLVLELAYQIKAEYPQHSIFWIQAAERLSFEKDVLEIGKKLRIPGIEDDKADVKNLFKQRLSHSSTERWFLILDNADDEALWGRRADVRSETPTLVQYLPNTTNGSIIITTRTRGVANFLAGKDVVELNEMSPKESVDIFTKLLERSDLIIDPSATLTLMQKLSYLPLAIVQAASYINITQRTVQTYLKLLDQSEEEVIKLLSKDFGDPSRYPNAKNPVAMTWLISFDNIWKHHQLAAMLLSSMACLHEKNIPRSLLPEVESEVDFIDAVGVLMGYAFIRRQTGSNDSTDFDELYDLHRLVRLAARNWLKMKALLKDRTRDCVTRVAELFPTRDHSHKGKWTLYLPHAQRLCEGNETKTLAERYRLLEKMGLCFVADGKYKDAVKMHSAVVLWREKNLGPSEELTLYSYNNLGEALNWKGDLHAAEVYLEKALQRQKEILIAEHPSTLTSMANLASTYRNQGRWKEAEDLEVQVIETSSRVLGAEHPRTLISMANLASTYRNQGRWKEAEELEVQVIETRTRVLGAEHPDKLTSMANLALIYMNQGFWKEAEELEVKVIETRTRIIGPEHPSTLTSMANLALTYMTQGRWKEAEELEVQVIETRTRVLGPEHPSTLTSMANLASTYSNQGRWKEAEELQDKACKICSRVLGAEHPNTLTSMANLASIYSNQGQWKEAEELEVQVIETKTRVLGAEHPLTLTSMANLASTYRNQGRWKEAEELEMQVMETSSRVLGPEHPSTLTSMANLASTYRNQGRWKEAEELEVQVIETKTRVLGAEHPNTLTSMSNLASTYSNQGQWKEAEDLEVQVMETSSRVLGAEHPLTLTSMANLASTYRNQGRWKEAEELEVQVMETRTRVLGPEHPLTLTSMANLAYTLKDQNQDDEATELMTSCLELSQKVLGASHNQTQSVLETLVVWLSVGVDTESQEGQSANDLPGAWVD